MSPTNPTSAELAGIPAGTWTIDPAHSSVGFTIRHLMSRVRGRFDEFHGSITIDEDLAASSAAATISMASVNTAMGMRDQDLRSPNFFDVEQYPTMTFTGTGLDLSGPEPLFVGDLTIKAVTRPVQITVAFLGLDETGLQGEPRIGFSGGTTLRRSDFGVGGAASEGAKIVVSDTVTVELDVEAFHE
jgi:polyisoprenoid-binding protein YceI